MTLEELKSLQPGDVVVITKIDENLNNGTTSKDYYVGEEMTFLVCDRWYDFLRPSKADKSLKQLGTIAHFSHGVSEYIERKVKLVRERKLNELGI
jgi:hypothetical protein